MKFFIITNHSYMLWQFRRELITSLLAKGEVILSMPFVGHEEDFAAMGCKCIRTEVDRRGINPVTDLKLYKTYVQQLKDEKPDMVITYSIKTNIYGGFACRQLKIPYCINVQGLGTAFQKEPIASIVTAMYKVALKKARTVFFENETNAEEFRKRGIVPLEKQTILQGAGVNLESYRFLDYPGEENGIHFLYLGRIMKEKGVEELFSAARSLKKSYGDKIHFDFVGFFEDEYKEVVEQMVQEGFLSFHGFSPDPKPYYGKSHCIVLPSYHEGMSNVLLEAAATGRALIATDIPGCKEAVEDGKNGFLCKKKDAESLENCLEKFLQLSSEERRRMGIAGREKMEREFDKKKVVEATMKAMELEK